jgi:hypothetical protein
MTNEKSVLELLFPKDTFNWFDLKEFTADENNVNITFEEKNLPPKVVEDKKLISKGFKDITITDFPIRGKRALLTFRRRYWQIEGQQGIVKNDIALTFPGTQLEKEFALFLKEDGGRQSGLAGFYSRVSAPPDQRI